MFTALWKVSAPWFVLEIVDYQDQWVLFTTKV